MAKHKGAKTKDVQAAKGKELIDQLKGIKMLGEVITWSAKTDGAHKHKDVVAALMAAGLDTKIAKEFLPRFAFTRAARKLTEAAVIDVLKDGEKEISFQFTKKLLKDEEWQYSKDTIVKLNKETGEISCEKQDLKNKAQQLLDESMEVRTTSDISKIVQRLFEKNADLFPLRDQGGVYVVPDQFTDFTDRIEHFLKELGGSIRRLPIPAGTERGDKAVAESIADAMAVYIQEHLDAVGQFTINTRKDTMEHVAEKIKETRVKIESYANHLKDMSELLLQKVDDANEQLRARIETVKEEKANAPEGNGGLFGHSVTAVIRWMGKQGWKFAQAKKALEKLGMQIANATIHAQLLAGRNGTRGEPAELSDKQEKKIVKAAA